MRRKLLLTLPLTLLICSACASSPRIVTVPAPCYKVPPAPDKATRHLQGAQALKDWQRFLGLSPSNSSTPSASTTPR